MGGDKLSTETTNPALKPPDINKVSQLDLPAVHESYTSQAQTNNFTLKVGAGLDRVIDDAFAVRVIGIDDVHLWAKTLNGRHYPNNLSLTTGVIVRFGTW